jgi:hypothetical protein
MLNTGGRGGGGGGGGGGGEGEGEEKEEEMLNYVKGGACTVRTPGGLFL